MKKTIALIAAALLAAASLSACSVPNAGKIEIISSPEAAGSAQPKESSAGGTDAQDSENESAPLSSAQMKELVDDGVVPGDAAETQDGKTVYDEEKIYAALREYVERIDCRTVMIADNNMVIHVSNGNAVAIPEMTVHVFYPDREEDLSFRQFLPDREILIPVDKGGGELPPAVSAEVSVSMNKNQSQDLSDTLKVDTALTGKDYTLTITNNSARSCQSLNVTAVFTSGSKTIAAQMQTLTGSIPPGETAEMVFDLPDGMDKSGAAAYVINEAVG